MAGVVDKFVKFHDFVDIASSVKDARTQQATLVKEFPCRQPGCPIIYKYPKSRDNHESKVHGLLPKSVTVPDRPLTPLKDYTKDHTEARLSFGLFLLNMQDAVKEGDGERLLRLYTVALLFYKAYGHHQYAYSTFLLTVQINATLSPSLAHSLKWNRFWNGKGGKGKNISLDLHLEHLNNFLKSFLKRSGPNMTEQAADRVSRSLGVLKEMMDTTDNELAVSKSSGAHHAANMAKDIACLVNVFKETRVFQVIPGRQYTSFPKFKRDLLSKLKHAELCDWMRSKLHEWRSVPI